MKPIEVRDFSVLPLYHDPTCNKEFMQLYFVIAHRMLWLNYPYKINYEPTLTAILAEPGIEYDVNNPYNKALVAINGKGSFTIDAEDRAINDTDMYACITEICNQLTVFMKENKQKYDAPVFSLYPELSSELFDEVRRFLAKGYDGR